MLFSTLFRHRKDDPTLSTDTVIRNDRYRDLYAVRSRTTRRNKMSDCETLLFGIGEEMHIVKRRVRQRVDELAR